MRLIVVFWVLIVVYTKEDSTFDTKEFVTKPSVDHGSDSYLETAQTLQQRPNFHNAHYDGVIQVPLKFRSGSYHITIQVGKMKNKFKKNLIVDTASRLTTWKDCTEGINPIDIDNRIKSGNRIKNNKNCSCMFTTDSICIASKGRKQRNSIIPSSTNGSVCVVHQKYSEGSSWFGYEKTDMVTIQYSTTTKEPIREISSYLTSASSFPLRYACQTSVTGLFQHQYADGILGLGLYNNMKVQLPVLYDNNNVNDTTTEDDLVWNHTHGKIVKSLSSSLFIDALYRNGIISYRSFSLCLTKSGGYLVLGGPLVQCHHLHRLNSSSSTATATSTLEAKRQTVHGSTTAADNPHVNLPVDVMKYTPIRTNLFDFNEFQKKTRKVSVRVTNDNNDILIKKKDYTTYSVLVEQVWIGNYCLTCKHEQYLKAFNSGKGTILDSGTTDTYLPIIVGNAFEMIWAKHHHRSQRSSLSSSSELKTVQYYYTIDQFRDLPNITFVFRNNVTLIVRPRNYMDGNFTQLRASTSYGSTAMNNNGTIGSETPFIQAQRTTRESASSSVLFERRLYTTEDVGAVLGISSMIGYTILFDQENQRIGIADSTCVCFNDNNDDEQVLKYVHSDT